MSFIKNSFSELELFKKSNWRNLFNNPISNNIGVYALLILIGLISFKTYKLSNDYFEKNEIRDSISTKFNTSHSKTISNQIDFFEIKTIYDSIEKNIKPLELNKANTILINNKEQPIKYEIQKSEREAFELGDIGDFIGGYFGFWLGIIGALLTFLAFYIQYKANRDVQKQFRLQQFETHFHKMIEVYLNNKDKFSIVGYKNPKNTVVVISGNTLQEKCTFQDDQADIKFIDYITKDHIVFQKFLVELKVVYRVFLEAYKEKNTTTELQLSKEIKKAVFTEAYKLFFNGLNKYEKADSYEDYINLGIKSLKKIRDKHRKDGSKKFDNFYKGINDKDKTLWVKLNFEPFKGYLHFLPQYYRNLYSIVKYVVNENEDINLSEKQKINYLRILRSTMSEYEQALLFYNWYSEMGNSWEDSDNKFFTEFKMIHNLNKMVLIDTELEIKQIFHFIGEKEFKEMFENYSHFMD